jgi:hypothetical protein
MTPRSIGVNRMEKVCSSPRNWSFSQAMGQISFDGWKNVHDGLFLSVRTAVSQGLLSITRHALETQAKERSCDR